MIITKNSPFTDKEILELKKTFGGYIKTVIDLEKKICSAGCDRHFESEQILLKKGSSQSTIWGGGIDTEAKEIDYNSFINIRPSDNNPTNEILDQKLRQRYEALTKYFFKELYE